MKRRLYCIYDFKAQAPLNELFVCHSNDDDAIRSFGSVCESPQSMVSRYPADFGLLFVGEVDFDNLVIELNSGSRFNPVITGDACVRALTRARAASTPSSDSSVPE